MTAHISLCKFILYATFFGFYSGEQQASCSTVLLLDVPSKSSLVISLYPCLDVSFSFRSDNKCENYLHAFLGCAFQF